VVGDQPEMPFGAFSEATVDGETLLWRCEHPESHFSATSGTIRVVTRHGLCWREQGCRRFDSTTLF
jgi:hypothetical protein